MESAIKSKKKLKRHPTSGRPKAIIDWEQVKIWLRAGGSATQIAAKLGIDRDTLYNRCQSDLFLDFSAFSQEYKEYGNLDLHVAQYHKAVKEKNTQMLIHLGEFRLGQVKGAQKQTQDLLEGLNAIVEDSRAAKAESQQTPKS